MKPFLHSSLRFSHSRGRSKRRRKKERVLQSINQSIDQSRRWRRLLQGSLSALCWPFYCFFFSSIWVALFTGKSPPLSTIFATTNKPFDKVVLLSLSSSSLSYSVFCVCLISSFLNALFVFVDPGLSQIVMEAQRSVGWTRKLLQNQANWRVSG